MAPATANEILSKHLGRPLNTGEKAYHINGDKSDNSIQNLGLQVGRRKIGQRVEDQIDWCLEFLGNYLCDDNHRIKIVNWVKSRYELE